MLTEELNDKKMKSFKEHICFVCGNEMKRTKLFGTCRDSYPTFIDKFLTEEQLSLIKTSTIVQLWSEVVVHSKCKPGKSHVLDND